MPNRRPPPLLSVAFAYGGVCLLVLYLLPRLRGPMEAFGARNPGALLLGADPARSLLWGVSTGTILASAGGALTRWTDWGRRFDRLLARLLGPLHPADALLLAALSAFGEELAFRGLALPYLGLVASSILFGLAHLVPRSGLWLWSVWAAAAGVVLGWAATQTGSLLAPTCGHFVVNAIGLLGLSRRAAEGTT